MAKDSAAFVIEWIDDDLHAAGIRELERSRKRHVSLVDHISFLVMRRRHLAMAFAFDPDFTFAGFRLFEGERSSGRWRQALPAGGATPKSAFGVPTFSRASRP